MAIADWTPHNLKLQYRPIFIDSANSCLCDMKDTSPLLQRLNKKYLLKYIGSTIIIMGDSNAILLRLIGVVFTLFDAAILKLTINAGQRVATA